MREIKLRAWDKENEEMILLTPNTSYSKFNDFILMQYTGKKDVDGKEIYESDILRYKNLHLKKYSEIVWSESHSRFVQRIKILFKTPNRKNKVVLKGSLSSVEQMKIIGNIYEGIK